MSVSGSPPAPGAHRTQTAVTPPVEPLLDRLDLAGAVITGDAARTQTGTARYICQRGADYVLTLKGNQPTLLASVTAKMFAATDPGHHLEIDHSHGRTVHGITSLDTREATAEAVATWVRRHWGVENKIHWVRDVVFAEDHQNAYVGAAATAWPCSATSRSA